MTPGGWGSLLRHHWVRSAHSCDRRHRHYFLGASQQQAWKAPSVRCLTKPAIGFGDRAVTESTIEHSRMRGSEPTNRSARPVRPFLAIGGPSPRKCAWPRSLRPAWLCPRTPLPGRGIARLPSLPVKAPAAAWFLAKRNPDRLCHSGRDRGSRGTGIARTMWKP